MSDPGAAKQPVVPLLSILIPVYNVAPFLKECVESILSQDSDLPIEIILLDDCSTDGSRKVAEELCEANREIIRLIVHRENAGVSAARNTLLAAASGDYIWFVDPDDKLFDTALASLHQILNHHQPDIILCDFSCNDGQQIASYQGAIASLGNDREALVRGVFATRKLHCWSKISRRQLWATDLRFPEGKVFEDIAIMPWLLLRARSFYYAPEKWVYYRQHSLSITAMVARSPSFDLARQDQYAAALAGFSDQMRAELGDVDPATNYAIAHFMAKIFTQIGYILLKEKLRHPGRLALSALTARYRAATEASSPINYAQLAREYRARGKFSRLIFLELFCWLADRAEGGPVRLVRPHQ